MENQHAGGLQQIDPLDASPLVVDTPSASARRQRFARLRSDAPVVVPSLLLCDFGHLADEVHKLEAAGVQGLAPGRDGRPFRAELDLWVADRRGGAPRHASCRSKPI